MTSCSISICDVTDHSILVEDLDDDLWWLLLDFVDAAEHDDFVEDEHLVPGWRESLVDHLCAQTLIAEHNSSERIGKTRIVRTNQTARLVHVCAQLEGLTLWNIRKQIIFFFVNFVRYCLLY